MAEGWISIHRKIQDNIIWSSLEPFDRRSAWIDLLLLANHEDNEMLINYETVTIKRGQCLVSVRKLGERWRWGKDRVLKYLKLLESLNMVQRSSINKQTLLTVENYGKYQICQDTVKDKEQTSNRRESATNNNENNDNKKNNNNNINNNRAFTPPTVEEVKAYCLERNNSVDPEAFVSFYESKGWMIGKNKMKDWKAAVRTWEKSRKGSSQGSAPAPKKNKFDNFEQHGYDYDALMKEIVNT